MHGIQLNEEKGLMYAHGWSGKLTIIDISKITKEYQKNPEEACSKVRKTCLEDEKHSPVQTMMSRHFKSEVIHTANIRQIIECRLLDNKPANSESL